MITRTDKASTVILVVFSALFAIAATLPAFAKYELTFFVWLVACVGTTCLAYIGFSAAAHALDKLGAYVCAPHDANNAPTPALRTRKTFVICFAIIELVFLIGLLSAYPGLCSTDSNTLIYQVTGQDYYGVGMEYSGLSNAHPIFYTFLLWIVFSITAFMGSTYASLFTFMLLQTCYVAACLAYALTWLVKTGASKTYVKIALAFVVISPVIAAHVIILWKDIPFAATVLLLVLHLVNYSKQEKPTLKQTLKLGILLLLVSLFRNNGYYVALIVGVYLLVFNACVRKHAAIVTATLIVCISLLHGPIFSAFSISQGHFAESVGIPLQQLGATLVAGGEIDESSQETLNNIFPLETWKECYNPETTNSVKHHEQFNNEYLDSHKAEFLSAWARTLPAHISTYVRAWVLETYGYWQPGYVAYIGTDNVTFNEEPAHDLLGLHYSPQLIANTLRHQFPFLLGMGSLIWFSLATLMFSIVNSKKQHVRTKASIIAAPYMPLIGLLATMLLAAPIVGDYRYIFSMYLVLPFLPQLYVLAVHAPNNTPSCTNSTNAKPPRRVKTSFMILIREWLFPVKPEKRS